MWGSTKEGVHRALGGCEKAFQIDWSGPRSVSSATQTAPQAQVMGVPEPTLGVYQVEM